MKTIKIRTAKHIVLLLASSSILYSHAGAQLEEVIVTAQKREQNLQNVPMAVSAFGREMLEENNVSSIRDLTQLVPSLRITELSNPTDRAIRVRGVGTDVYSGAVEPNVSVVVDEVPLARTSMAMLEFDDLERVEVLRGPQGT
ncbi:TonB-dependent receptor plug domain-containing protein, partial [Zhongshania sp.]